MHPHCDLDLEDNNLKLSHNIQACNDAPTGYKRFQNSGDMEETVIFLRISPYTDLDLEERHPMTMNMYSYTPVNKPINKLSSESQNKIEIYRKQFPHKVCYLVAYCSQLRYLPDKGVTDGQTDRQAVSDGWMDRRTT